MASGDLLLLNDSWYVTNTGLLGLAQRRRCRSIQVELLGSLSDPMNSRYVFKASVYRSTGCKGFVGHGDADPSNVSALVRGAELRIAETRAVNRALRKAYGIGICSVEELGCSTPPSEAPTRKSSSRAVPSNGCANMENRNGTRLRDQLCQLIRRHGLDPQLVKAYATAFCGTNTLREASRDQIDNFIRHLADWAEKDRNALVGELNRYLRKQEEGAA